MRRNPEEWKRFQACLRNMHVPYTHDRTMVLRLDYKPPLGIMECVQALGYEENLRTYEERGWCRFERQVSGMKSMPRRSVSAEEESGATHTTTKVVPVHPDDFNKVLESLQFTNGRTDSNEVKKLYRKVFSARTAVAKKVVLSTCTKESLDDFWNALVAYRNLEDFATCMYVAIFFIVHTGTHTHK